MARVLLKNVRLSFPVLFEPEQFDGQGKARYSAAFLVEPDSENDAAINAAIQEVAEKAWGKKAEPLLKAYRGSSNKFCYTDGSLKEYDGYEGNFCLAAHRNEEAGPPKVVDKDKSELSVTSGKPYAGCYVNGIVDFWAQSGQYPGVRCTLVAVQFAGDGEAFAGAPASADEFEDLSDGDDFSSFGS